MRSNFWLYGAMALALSLGACSSSRQSAHDPQPAEATPAEATPAEAQRPYQGQGYPEAPVTGVAGLGPAPDAVIIDSEGQPVSLARLWQSDNVLLVFYRGHW